MMPKFGNGNGDAEKTKDQLYSNTLCRRFFGFDYSEYNTYILTKFHFSSINIPKINFNETKTPHN